MSLPGARIPTSALRRLTLLGTALVLVTLSCSRDVTAPDGGGTPRFANGLSFQTEFPPAPAGASLPDLVRFTQVRVVLHHSDGSLALDTLVAYPAGADSIVLSLSVPLLRDAPSTGEPLALTLDYLDADGVVVFHGGPITVLAAPGVQSIPPVTVPVSYTGPGARARSVRISPDTLTVPSGGSFAFTASALDSVGNAMPGTPIAWRVLDSGATLAADSAGRGTAGVGRLAVRVAATLLTGPADTATLLVQPAPSAIVLVSGDAQTGPVSARLASPVTVKVIASDSGGVGGVPVTFVAASGGSVDTATVNSAADGLASAHWKLGSSAGDQTLTASATGLAGSPVTFHATAVAGPATTLAFSTQPPDTVTAGHPFAAAVTAHDSAGNVATSFTGPVSVVLGTNPAADSLNGTLTVNATEGVATFSTLRLSKADTGYRLLASSTGLASATSSPFRVISGALAGCSLVSGGGQTAALNSALAPIVVLAVDSAGNPVANATLAASVNAGGSLGSSSPVTDATGRATIAWTLGTLTGTQTLSVTCASQVLTVTATATGASLARAWTGAVSSVWAADSNWSPLGIPGITDSVYIPSAPARQPVLSAATTVKSLALQAGATLTLGADTLTLTGNLDAGTGLSGTPGLVQLTGGGTLGGTINAAAAVSGSYALSRASAVSGALTVEGSGSLALNHQRLVIDGALATAGSGKLVMVNAEDTLEVLGNAQFAGGDETGQLTAGLLIARAGFTQGTNATSFVASPAFVTRFTAPSLTLGFGMPASSHFGRLELADSTLVTITGNVTATGDVWLPTGLALQVQSAAGDSVFVGGSLYDSTGGRWQAANTVLTGVNARVPKTMSGNLVVAASNALADSLKLTGALTITGTGTVLDLGGQRVWVTDSLATMAGGALKMASAADTLWVAGNANFQGGSTAGLLTAGYLEIAGPHFVQGTNAQAFSATAPHATYFDDRGTPGAVSHTLTFANAGFSASHFGDLYVGDTLTVLGSDVYADGELETGFVASHHVMASADHLLVSRGADVNGLVWDNVRWQLVAGGAVSQLGTVTFRNISNTTGPQFEWNRPGSGATYALTGWTFSTAPTGAGLYVKMTSSAPVDTLDLESHAVTPVLSGGFTQALGGGVVVWPNALTYTGPNRGDWNTYGNWNYSGALIPDSTTDVIIPAGDTVLMSAPGSARNLTLASAAQLSQASFDLDVYGNLATDTSSGGIVCAGTEFTTQRGGPGAATVEGNFCRYRTERAVNQVGPVRVSSLFHADNGIYDLNGHTLATQQAWVGAGQGTGASATGALRMVQATDSLQVSGALLVAGDSATPSAGVSTLTAGVITVGGDVHIFGAPGAGYFNSQPAQHVVLSGVEAQLLVTDSTASGFGTLTVQGTSFFLDNPLRVSGDLYLMGYGGFSGANGRVSVAGNLYGGANSSLTIGAFELAGVNADTGEFSPDTAIYTGTGQVILDSLAAGLGNFSYKSIRVAGSATMQPYGTLPGAIYMTGSLIVSGTGSLTVGNGQPFQVGVSDSLVTRNSGTLRMTGASDSAKVVVLGNASFAGGDETGKLTGGTLELHGSFSQGGAPNAFVADTGFVTRFAGSSSTVTFGSPATARFGRLEFSGAPAVTLASNITVGGDVYAPAGTYGSVTSAGADSVFLHGSLGDNSTTGMWQVNTTVLKGVNARFPVNLKGNLVVAASNALADSLKLTGALTVTGAGTVLDVNGQRVWVSDSLATANGGVLKMVNATDSLWVKGNASFLGGSTAGMLTNGYLWLAGASFVQGTNAQAFAATAPHVTYFADIAGSPTHAILFANPGAGASHFGDLYLGDTLTLLGSDVHALGELETGVVITHRVRSSADHLLVTGGANVNSLRFDNVRWQLVDGDAVTQLALVTFDSIANSAAAQFEWNRAGTGTTYALTNWQFGTPPTGAGVYVKMTSTGTPDTLNLGDHSVTPAASGGLTDAAGGGAIIWPAPLTFTGPVHGSWNTYGNWNNSSTTIPDSTMDVIIPDGDTVAMSASGSARSLVVGAGAQLYQGNYELEVHGDLTTDTQSGSIGCAGTETTGFTTQVGGPGAAKLQGNLCRYRSTRPIIQVGRVSASAFFQVQDSTYNLNGYTVQTQEAWIGGTNGATGALNMSQASDSLIVGDSLMVGGNYGTPSAGVSTLTNGVISIDGNVRVYGAPGAGYFNSQPTQQVVLNGGESNISFQDTTASAFGSLWMNGLYYSSSVLRVSGNLRLVGYGGLDVYGAGARLKLAGSLYGGPNSSLSGTAFELAGANLDSGYFSPDTVVYTGTNQLILDSLAAGTGGFNYNSIRVAGSATMQPYGSLPGTIYMSGNLIVSGTGTLTVGNGKLFQVNVSDSLITRDAGTLRMSGPPDSSVVAVQGNALFAGGDETGKLTGGRLDLRGDFEQASVSSATSFAPSGDQLTRLTGTVGQTVTFESPGTGAAGSHFASLALADTSSVTGIALGSDIFVDDTLSVVAATGDSATFFGNGHTVTAAGASISGFGGTRLVFNDAPFRFVDGTGAVTLQRLTFRNFGTAVAFDDARSDSVAMDYPRWEGTPLNGNFLHKSGSGAALTLYSPNPIGTLWTLGVYYLITGGGSLVIPPA
jgi:hypothetical protein